MSTLPKIKQPVYDCDGIEYRGFTHAEEKILLQVKEESDSLLQFKNILKVIEQCTFGKIDVMDLSPAMMELLFVRIRAKSVGEVHKLKYRCKTVNDGEPCGQEMIITLNLDEVEMKPGTETVQDSFMLDQTLGIKLKQANVGDLLRYKDNDTLQLAAYIDNIYDKEQVYHIEEIEDDELEVFIDSIPSEKKKLIKDYIGNSPQTTLEVDHECEGCGHKHHITFRGLSDFFG